MSHPVTSRTTAPAATSRRAARTRARAPVPLVARGERTRQFQAPRAKIWIDMHTGLVTRIQNYDSTGKRKGGTRLSAYDEMDGIWLPREMRMEDRKGDLKVLITADNITLNKPVPDEAFVYVPADDMVILEEIPPLGDPPDVLFLE